MQFNENQTHINLNHPRRPHRIRRLISGGNSAAAALVNDKVNTDYRGGSSFNLAGVAPNVARCGAFPENVELSFTGSGIDTEGGYNTAVFSACTNTTTNRVFDLKATDTYLSGD